MRRRARSCTSRIRRRGAARSPTRRQRRSSSSAAGPVRRSRFHRGSGLPRHCAAGRPATGTRDRDSHVSSPRSENANSSTTSPAPRAGPGRDGAAIEHLTRAVELAPRFAELAQTDDDFDAIRGDAASRRPGAQPQASPGSLTPPARARNAGTTSCSGCATRSTAECSRPGERETKSSSPTASANALCASSPPNGTSSSGRACPRSRRRGSPPPSKRPRPEARRRSTESRSQADSCPSAVARRREAGGVGGGGRKDHDVPGGGDAPGPVPRAPVGKQPRRR